MLQKGQGVVVSSLLWICVINNCITEAIGHVYIFNHKKKRILVIEISNKKSKCWVLLLNFPYACGSKNLKFYYSCCFHLAIIK